MHLPKSAVEGRPASTTKGETSLNSLASFVKWTWSRRSQTHRRVCCEGWPRSYERASAEHPCSGGVLPPVGA